jgi:hypothetical protein
MILLGVILLIIGIFYARNILWPIAAILILIGVLLVVLEGGVSYY